MTHHSDDEIRDEAWKEFARREQYGYTDVESNIAFDGGWAAALSSPVIRRIQADALRDARADIQAYTDSGSPFGHRPVEEFLDKRADRIERGE